MIKSLSTLIQNSSKQFNFKPVYEIKRESRGKQLRKKIQYREARPWLFKRQTRIRPPDLTQANMTFPIHIPIKVSYIYRPIKNKIIRPTHDFINFKQMTGNEILLHLENPENLRQSELCGALVELSKKEIENYDWNTHEWIQNTITHIKGNIDGYTPSTISYIALSLYRLKIKDEELWQKLQFVVDKTMHKFTPKGFGYTYVAFLENQIGDKAFREKLSLRLPIHLHKMSPLLITKCFEVTITNKLMNDHLFDNHFHVLFWRRLQWFQNFYPQIIDNLVEMEHKDDPEFWEESFLPSIYKIKFTKEELIVELITALQNLNQKLDIKVEEQVKYLEKQLEFVSTKVKAIENAQFYNVVMNDLIYFEQKQKLKLQKQEAAQN